MKKIFILFFLYFFSLTSCLNTKKKEEIFKCVVTSCTKIEAISIHDEINRPLGFKVKTSCGRSFKSKLKYQIGDTIEVIKVSYD